MKGKRVKREENGSRKGGNEELKWEERSREAEGAVEEKRPVWS